MSLFKKVTAQTHQTLEMLHTHETITSELHRKPDFKFCRSQNYLIGNN